MYVPGLFWPFAAACACRVRLCRTVSLRRLQESRRIDNQLRGRSGRQGDPGSTRYFLSLEDKCAVLSRLCFVLFQKCQCCSRLCCNVEQCAWHVQIGIQVEQFFMWPSSLFAVAGHAALSTYAPCMPSAASPVCAVTIQVPRQAPEVWLTACWHA